MSTLVYAPGVKVYVDTYKHGLLDVSEDLISGGMTRRQNAPSSLNFSLNNARRKYDNVFMPNDRVVVMMKRLTWMRTYTGYLNKVPLFSAWPRVIDITSTCSLKRLQYFYWDPGIEASRNLVKSSLLIPVDGSEPDGGIKQIVLNLLEQVVDWSGVGGSSVAQDDVRANQKGKKVHIGEIPKEWFKWVLKIRDAVLDNIAEEQAVISQLQAALGSLSTIGGAPLAGAGAVSGGTYNDLTIDGEQAGWANAILSACKNRGVSTRDMEYAIGCAIQESKLHNLTGGDRDSVGLFQQRPSQGWGTVDQCRDPAYATNKFLDGIVGISDRDSKPFTYVIQSVQRSGYPDAYAKWEGAAKQIVAAFNSPPSLGGDAGFKGYASGTTQSSQIPDSRGSSDSNTFMSQGIGLVNRNPNIRYHLGGDAEPTDPDPQVLDCSSFVRWVYLHTMGDLHGMPRSAREIYQWCINNGGAAIPADVAMQTPGALVFRSEGGPSSIHHIEISLGTGHSTVGAHSTAGGVGIRGQVTNYYNYGALVPNVTYAQGVQPYFDPNSNDPHRNGDMPPRPGQQGYTGSPVSGGQAATAAHTDGNPKDFLFGSATAWNPVNNESNFDSQGFVGIRALANDTPILPYIAQLLASCLRSFSSAPNGDFIAWFPDYYGLWGTAAKMILQPIEVMDFTVDWDDAGLVTHQFVTGAVAGTVGIDVQTGAAGSTINSVTRFQSAGVATIDIPAVMAALFGLEATDTEAKAFLKVIYDRFGPRPKYDEVQGIQSGTGEFFYALFLFMQQWAYQYNANIPLTFMPELWPGMLLQMPFFNFQAYVNEVTHAWTFGPNGSFTTSVNIAAPARLNTDDPRLTGLPLAGGANAGHTVNDPTFGSIRGGQRVAADGKTALDRKLDRLTD